MTRLVSLFVLTTLLTFAAAAHADSPQVWVQPFDEANSEQSPDWVNRAIRQALVDELSSFTGVEVSTAATKPADARFIVTATIQRTDSELRVTGQITDAISDKTVGGFKATGTAKQLFAIEDSIATQVARVVAPDAKPALANAQGPGKGDAPFQPVKLGFDGSELQQAMRNNQPLQPVNQPTYVPYEVPTYPQYTSPVNSGFNNGFNSGFYNNGFGYLWGNSSWPSVIIINSGNKGQYCPRPPTPCAPTATPAFRGAPYSAPVAPPPPVVTTFGPRMGTSFASRPAPGVVMTVGR